VPLPWFLLVCAAIAVCGVSAVLVAARRRLTVVVVRGESMSPAFHSGDRVLVARTAGWSAGDVVVFRYASGPDEKLIKRVAAVAGDPVPSDVLAAVREEPGTRVPDGFLVVIGDAVQSTDSRSFGYLSADAVIGVVARRLDGGGRGRIPAARRTTAGPRARPARTEGAAAAGARQASGPPHGAALSRSRPDPAP
jgi:signal peptidase I